MNNFFKMMSGNKNQSNNNSVPKPSFFNESALSFQCEDDHDMTNQNDFFKTFQSDSVDLDADPDIFDSNSDFIQINKSDFQQQPRISSITQNNNTALFKKFTQKQSPTLIEKNSQTTENLKFSNKNMNSGFIKSPITDQRSPMLTRSPMQSPQLINKREPNPPPSPLKQMQNSFFNKNSSKPKNINHQPMLMTPPRKSISEEMEFRSDARSHVSVQNNYFEINEDHNDIKLQQDNLQEEEDVIIIDASADSRTQDDHPSNSSFSEAKFSENQTTSTQILDDQKEFTQEEDKERFQLLQLKLKSETERIQKWRRSIDIELKEKNKKLDCAEETISNLRKCNLELQMKIEDLSLKFTDELEYRSDLEKKVEDSRKLCFVIKEEIEKTKQIQCKSEGEVVQLRNERDILCNHFKSLSEEINTMQSYANELHSKHIRQMTSKSYQIESIRAEHLKAINKLEIEKNESIRRFNALQYQIDTKESDLKKQEILINSLNSTIENIKRLLAKSFIELQSKEETINNLQKDTKEMKVQIETTSMENTTLKEDLCLIQESERNLRQNILSVQESMNAEIKCRLELSEMLQATISQLETEKSNLFSQGIELKEVQINLEKERAASQSLEQRLLEEKVQSLENLELVQQELQTKTELLDSTVTRLTTAEESIVEMEEKTKQLNDEKDELLMKFSNLELTNEKCADELNQTRKYVNDLETINDEKCNTLSRLEEEKAKASEFVETLQKSLKEHEELSNKLHEDLSEAKKNFSSAESCITTLQEEILEYKRFIEQTNLDKTNSVNELDDLLHSERSRNTQFEATICELKSENDAMAKKIDFLTADNTEMKNRFELKSSEMHSHVEVNSELSTRLQNAEEELRVALKNNNTLADSIVELSTKLNQVGEQKNSLQAELSRSVKEGERVREELLYTLDQCQKNSDSTIGKKDKELEALKAKLETQKKTKNVEKKLNEVTAQLEKQKDEYKDILNQKKELSKKISDNEETIVNLQTKNTELEEKFQKCTSELQQVKTQHSKQLEQKSNEIGRLRSLEVELQRLKSKTVVASPQRSQLPADTIAHVTRTPKSPGLTASLTAHNTPNKINAPQMKNSTTPQKTPRSILRQPGSASKRRRVFFGGENQKDMSDLDSNASEMVDLDLEKLTVAQSLTKSAPPPKKPDYNVMKTPIAARTPKTFMRKNVISPLDGEDDGKFGGKIPNIRKTPSKTPNRLNDAIKLKDSNWFDSDNVFGMGFEA